MKQLYELDKEALRMEMEIASLKGFWTTGCNYPWEMVTVPPNWVGLIDRAWELLDEVKAAGYRAGVWMLKDGYNCVITKPAYLGGDKEPMEVESAVAEAQGPTAPIAICKAWLAWKQRVTG